MAEKASARARKKTQASQCGWQIGGFGMEGGVVLGNGGSQGMQARIEQRRMDLIMRQIPVFTRGDADLRECFLMAAAIPLDALKCRPVFETAFAQCGIKFPADSLFKAARL